MESGREGKKKLEIEGRQGVSLLTNIIILY